MTRRKLNVRFLLCVLGAFFVAGAALAGVHHVQVRRQAYTLLERGDRAAEDRPDLALVHYNRYLALVPGDVDAQEKYVRALDRRVTSPAERVQLVVAIQRVLNQKPDSHDLRYRLVHNLILVGRLADAIHQLKVLQGRWSDEAELQHLLGWCLEAREQYREAAAAFQAALRLDPARLESHTLLAEVLQQRLGQVDEARAVLDGMIFANPKSFRAYLTRARFHLGLRKDDAADQDVKTALELAPHEAEVIVFAAERYQAKAQAKEALVLLTSGLEHHPAHALIVRALAELHVRQGETDAAIKLLSASLARNANADELRVLLIDLLFDLGKIDQAGTKLRELHRDVGLTPLTQYLQGRLLVEQKQATAATPLLERARAELPARSPWSGRVNVLLGLCHQHGGDLPRAIEAFRRAVQEEPGWTATHVGLGSALLGAGRVDEALSELRRVQDAPDAPPDLPLLIARALLQQTLRQPEERRDWTALGDILAQARKVAPGSAELVVVEAHVAAARKDYPAAQQLLDKAIARHPEGAAAWCARAELAARQEKLDEALAILDQAAAKLGSHIELSLARSRVLAVRASAADRQELETLAQTVGRFTPDERTRLLRALAEVWQSLGEPAHAQSLWQRLAQDLPDDIGSRSHLLENALQAGQTERARTLIAELYQLEGPHGLEARFGEAALLVQQARGERARLAAPRKLLAALARLHPELAKIPLLEAKIDELEGNYAQAASHYAKAIELGEAQPRHVNRLLQLLLQREDFLRGEEIVQQAQRHGPLTPDIARLAAEVALGNRNTSAALQRAAQAVRLPSRDYRDYLWLAHVHEAAGDNARAEANLRSAVLAASHTAEPWVALAAHLARTEQAQAAARLVEELNAKVPADRRTLTLARCLEAFHQIGPAEAAFERALSERPGDFLVLLHLASFHRQLDQPGRAEPFLRQLLDPKVGAPAEQQAQARRWLAVVLADRGTAGDRAEALGLLTANIRARGETSVDQRARLYVLGTDPAQRAAALAAFQASLRRLPASPEDRLLLASLFVHTGQLGQARATLLPLVTQPAPTPQSLAHFARVLLQTEEFDEAAEIVTRLEKLEPRSARTLKLKEYASTLER